MAYKLEFDQAENVDLLKPVLENVLKEEADLFIVTEDGDTVETHKILLSMFSRSLATILSVQSHGEGVPGLSIPVNTKTAGTLSNCWSMEL